MKSVPASLALAAALLLPSVAEAAMQSGPIARVRVEGRYDQNLMEGGGDAAGLVQPMVGWRLEDPTTRLEATYALDLLGYAQGGAGRGGVNHRLRGIEQFQLDRRTVLLLRQGAERVYDPTALSRPGVVRAAGTSTYGEASIDLQRRIGARWTAGLGYRAEIATLEAENTFDGAVHAPSAFLNWAWTRRDTVGVRYRLQYFDAFGGEDGYSHEPALFYVRALDKTTTLEAQAGPAVYEAEGVATVVPRGRVELVHRRPRLTLAASYERGLVGSTGYEGALWTDSLAASAMWRLAEPLRLSLVGGAFRNGNAPDEQAFVEGFAGAVGLEYEVDRDLAVTAVWRRVAQSNVVGSEAVDLSRNIFALGLTWQFQGGRLPR